MTRAPGSPAAARAVRAIRRVGMLSGASYERTTGQVGKIETVLNNEVRALARPNGPARADDDLIEI